MVGLGDGEDDDLAGAVFGFADDDESAGDGAVDFQGLGVEFLDVLEAFAEVFEVAFFDFGQGDEAGDVGGKLGDGEGNLRAAGIVLVGVNDQDVFGVIVFARDPGLGIVEAEAVVFVFVGSGGDGGLGGGARGFDSA